MYLPYIWMGRPAWKVLAVENTANANKNYTTHFSIHDRCAAYWMLFDSAPTRLKMDGTDDRCIVGARVHAKATQVTHLEECSRRYGSDAKTKRVSGTVVSVELLSRPEKTRKSCFITADYELGGDVLKRAKLNIRSVRAGEATVADPSTIPT